jgi:hypothetical protein
MTAAVPFLLAGSTLFSAMGSIAQGNAQAAAYNANAEAQYRQGIQERNVAISKAGDQERDSLLHKGAMAAAYGASGVDAETGTPLEAMSDQASQDELARHRMLWQGQAEQQSSTDQANVYRAQASAAKRAGYMSALGSLFQAGTSFAMWKYNPVKAGPSMGAG